MQYFCSQKNEFGIKIYTQPEKTDLNISQIQQKYSQSIIGGVPSYFEKNQLDANERTDTVKFAFYREEGLKAKIENFESN